MQALLQRLEGETKASHYDYDKEAVQQATHEFLVSLQNALPRLQQTQKEPQDQPEISVEWLKSMCQKVQSDLGVDYLMQAVLQASQLNNAQHQEEALFLALGASDSAMQALMEIAPRLDQIRRLADSMPGMSSNAFGTTGASAGSVVTTSTEDPQEIVKEQLRIEAIDTAHVAAIAQAELEAHQGPPSGSGTHTITRTSDKLLVKNAKKAAKRAAQALEKAKAAGAILDEADFLKISSTAAVRGSGGLLHQSQEQMRALQASLLPEGTRQLHPTAGLPAGTIREDFQYYEKVTIPPPIRDASTLHPRLQIQDILEYDSAKIFEGTISLNPMQSTLFDTAYHRRENMLVCAPTGAGKTNVALLTVAAHFQKVGLIGDDTDPALETGHKVVYIAPMKALAQEVVEKFSSKLKKLRLVVRELTGDMQLTRAEAQSANVIVTTPEKWDVVTRKSGNDENSLGNQCGLLIIDEVHLLADDRGAVIESVVSRLHRLVESRQKQIRIVGLSATLPNYQDVAKFLQVPEKGLFFFGPEHRPVPLQQTFVGVTGNIKDRRAMEEKMDNAGYEIVKDSLARGYQVMVFVHSRKGTSDTAMALASRATSASELERYFTTQGQEGSGGEAFKRFVDRVKKSKNREIANHFYNGMGIHHAGMLRGDRKLTESMFAAGAIKVLCCTATLAWGVNLPAHTVVIKGTDVYNPEKGKNMDLSILDVQQIFGRAGRPQFDSSGEATLITNHAALTRYLDKLVRAVPIESKFIKQLSDHLNAEIVGGTVTNIRESVTWLTYTYLYVRMLQNPLAYGITEEQKNRDPMLLERCRELVMEAATNLARNKMINYHAASGNLSMTTLGRVAAHFYINTESISSFHEAMSLRPEMSDTNVLHLVVTAAEFENVRVRQEEQNELDSIKQKVPIDLEGPVNDSATKTFVLVQAFVSRERPRGFTLISDTNYIASNAGKFLVYLLACETPGSLVSRNFFLGRVARALFEMCIHDNKAGAALKLMRLAKSVDSQIWWFQTPLRHFEGDLGSTVLKAIESKLGIGRGGGYDTFASLLTLLDMMDEEVGQLGRGKRELGRKIKNFVSMIPNPLLTCRVLPVTRDVLRFLIEITPSFRWHGRWHGGAQSFWLWIEDSRSERM